MKKILFLFAAIVALSTSTKASTISPIISEDVDPTEDLQFPIETQVPTSDSDFPPFEDWFDFGEGDF